MRAKKASPNRSVAIMIVIAMCALLCGILANSFRLSRRINNDLRENAYDSLMDASEIIRQNIDSSVQDDINLVGAYGRMLQRTGYDGLPRQLREFCEVNGLYHVYYLDNSGVGMSETGARFERDALPVRETALEGVASVSTGFVGETGQRHLMVQAPIFDDGGVAGALYAEVVATRYYSEDTFIFRNGEGRASLFNRTDGSFVIKAPQTALAHFRSDSIFDSVAESDDGTSLRRTFTEKVTAGAKSILQMSSGGESAYIAILPCKTNPDLYVATIISRQALEVETDSMSRLIITMQSILIIGMGGLIVMGSFLLYRVMKDRQQRATRELEQMYQNRSREELTAALIRAQEANAAKTQFLSNMSHDIRTPMNAIIGMATIAGQNIGDADKLRECLRVITSSSHHLLDLINDILDVSRIESGSLTLVSEPFALPIAIDGVVSIISPLCMAKEQTLTVELIGVEHEYLLGDKTKLSQVLVNLLNNANKFTPAGGSVKLVVEETPTAEPAHAAYRISVTDNGIGIAEEDFASVFDPFERAENAAASKVEGSGLGLFIARSIVQAMGGTLTLASQVGVGTTFTATLSLPVPEAFDPAEAYRALRGMRALVVGRPDSCAEVLRDLADIGVITASAASGRQAEEALRRARAVGDGCDMVIVDMDAPDADCAETIRPLRQALGADAPIIVLAADDRQGSEAAVHAAGADACIVKPVFQSRLYEQIAGLQRARSIREPSSQALTGRRLLLTDDNYVNQAVAKKLLEGGGALVELANNGQESVDMFTASPQGYYDAILMDIQMPVMNGYEAARMIRGSAHPDAASIPIVALTAEVLTESVQRATAAGVNAYLSKPIEPRNMIDTLRRLTER